MKDRGWWICLAVLILLLPYLGQAAEMCYRGQRLYTPWKGPKVCLWCDAGTFMPDEEHSHEKCYPCTTIQDPQLEKLVSPCTSKHDTGIHCIGGYYRTQPSYPEGRGHCQPCTRCHFPKRPCQTYRDAMCCPGDDYIVIIKEDGRAVCARECGRGHLSRSYDDQCVPCPQNTYMDEEKHVNTYCKICEVPKSHAEKMVGSCNATHPTVIACIEGYSRQFSNVEQPDHGECVKLCGIGRYLDPVTETCQTCAENTYMDKEEYSHAYECKPCATPKSENEIIVRPCNSTHPTVIGCVEGFYRRLSDDLTTSTCAPCRICSKNTDGNVYEGRACGELSNSVCCPRPDMAVVEARDGPVCVFLHNKPADSPTCGEGEFLYIYTTASGHSVTCLPCPQGTYMDKIQHTSTSCTSCTEFPNTIYCNNSNGPRAPEKGLTVTTVSGLMIGVGLLFAVIQSVVSCALKYWWRRRKLRTRIADDNNEAVMPLLALRESETPRRRRTRSTDSDSGMLISRFTHKEFISIPRFNTSHLPYQYCDDIMVDLVKLQAKLTTLINIKHSSDRRPKNIPSTDSPYPYSEERYKNEPHAGTGWVQGVKMYKDISCPCDTCKLTDTPQKEWGEVVICTATRVVFDITEGKNCQCYFFYENDDTDLLSCPSLSGAVKVLSDVDRDWCYMTFVTHNLELVQERYNTFTKYHRLRREVQHKYKVVTDDTTYENLTDKLAQVHSRSELSLNLLEKEIEEIQKNPEKYRKTCQFDAVTNYGFWLHENPNSFRAFLDITTVDQEDATASQRLITMLSSLHRTYSHCREEIALLKKQLQQNNVEDEDVLLDKYRELCGRENELSRSLRRLILNLRDHRGDSSDTDFPHYPHYQSRYNSDHVLTIVVSHPEGRSQQISLGEITDRKSFWNDHHSIYRYTNKTCRGCEGARVFILGRTGLSDHSHSGNVGQLGESGAWSDVIPYIINLSAIARKK